MLCKSRKPQPRLIKNNKGVTLVEVIAVIAIMSVVMAAVTGFVITGAKMSAQVSDQAGTSMREQTAVEYINQRLWEGTELSATGEGLQIEYNEQQIYVYPILEIDDKAVTTTVMEGTGQTKVTYNSVELCNGNIYFWIEQDNLNFELITRIHLIQVMDKKTKKGFIDVSSSKKNAAATGIAGKLRNVVENMMYPEDAAYSANPLGYGGEGGAMLSTGWSLKKYKNAYMDDEDKWDEIEKSIIANVADDVIVSIKGSDVEIVIRKNFA